MSDQTRVFGKYEIMGEVGRGGFATVYRARDVRLQREVALKMLDPSRGWEPGFAARFLQEARAAAQLKHPNIITIYEIDDVDGQLYIAMELAEGGTLRDALQRQPEGFSVAETTTLLAQVASALDYAHARGMVHRDVKPANILIDPEAPDGPRAILSDFGLVKALAQSTELTQSGAILGTVEYMAPEQADSARRAEVGPASDLYALGVVAYHMLTGQVPFSGSTAEVLVSHLTKKPSSLRDIRRDLPRGISDAVLRALSKEPTDRFASARDFVTALQAAAARAIQPGPATRLRASSVQVRQRVQETGRTWSHRLRLLAAKHPQPQPAPRQRRPWPTRYTVLLLVGLLALVGAGSLYLGVWRRQPRVVLYFTSTRAENKREIYGLLTDGAVERITYTAIGESWMPVKERGGSLYFVSTRTDHKREIYRLDQGDAIQITHTPGKDESWAPAISASGDLYFVSDRDGSAQIYRLVQGGIESVTSAGANDSPVFDHAGRLYFTSDRDGKQDIYFLDQHGVTRVTVSATGQSWAPAPTADGLYFTSTRDGVESIYRLVGDSGALQRLTNSTFGRARSPVLGEDGRVYFTGVAVSATHSEVYTFAQDGQPERVTATPGGAYSFVGAH